MPTVKIVFGDTASRMHSDGASDEEVEEYGDIQTTTFATKAEADAYIKGLEDMNGWMDFCFYEEN